MPDFGAPVAQNVQSPDVTKTLSGLMGLQQQKQALQSGAQQLQVGANTAQAAQQTMQERQGITQMMQSGVDDQGNSIRDANGEPDVAKVLPALGRMAPLTGQQYAQSLLQTHTAKVSLQTAATSLDSQQRSAIMGPIQSIATNPADPDAVTNASGALDQWAKQHPEMAPIVNSTKVLLGHIQTAQDPAQRAQMANSLSAMLQPGQAVQTQPTGSSIDNGATTMVGTTAPPVAGGSFTSNTVVPKMLPPTTGTVGSDGTPGVIGTPQAHFEGLQGPGRAAALATIAATNPDQNNQREAANVMAGRPQGFVPQGLPAGQAQNIANNVDEMNKHFAGLGDAAAGTQLVTGLTGNIKALADGAATGVGGGKKAYAAGLLNAIGLGGQATGDLQKDTDLLSKNMAMLSLGTPAGSDAARSLVDAARPNTKMGAPAIQDAADQVASQAQASMAMRNMLAPAKMMGDPVTYQAQRQKLESIADPRAWQYVNLRPGSSAAKAFMSKLQPSDSAALVQKVDQLEQMGMLK